MSQTIYIRFEGEQQVESILDSVKPSTGRWFKAPFQDKGHLIYILDKGLPRLETSDELLNKAFERRKFEVLEGIAFETESIRSEITKDTTSKQREGWQVKASIARLYRIETLLKRKGVLGDTESLLTEKETNAIAIEVNERGLNESASDLIAVWEDKGGNYAMAVGQIDGISSRGKDQIKNSTAETLEGNALNLKREAEEKRDKLEVSKTA